MFLGPLKSSAGFTYLAVLMLVIVMGIMLGVAGQSYKMIADREREEELLWVGSQYREAMLRWRNPPAGIQKNRPLGDIKFLLAEPSAAKGFRYLRKLYLDPITGTEFNIIKDPNQGIIGIASASEKEPIKQANFPKDFLDFEGKKKYSDWQFTNKPAPQRVKTGGATGLPPPSVPPL